MSSENNPEVIIAKYKQMTAECQQIAGKVQELNIEKDEHRLVLDTLGKLNGDRKTHRLVGGVLVERTVEDVLPDVKKNYEMIQDVIVKLDQSLTDKDTIRKEFKEKHGIMTQDERDALMNSQGEAGKGKK